MSSLILHEVTSREELDAVINVVWKAFHNPYRPDFQALHPVFGATPADRESAVKADKERTWNRHAQNPASHWFYVSDASTREILGGTEWLLYTENPFPDGPKKLECTWYPAGEAKDFVTEIINQVYLPRQTWMRRPHIALNQMGVHPEHRKRGVGKTLMMWGINKARELNLESFIEASESGRYLYEQFGYRVLLKIAVDPVKRNPSDEWRKLTHELTPLQFYAMWRPANGTFEEAESKTLWEFMKHLHL